MPPRKAERIGEATDSKTDMRLLSFLGATDVAPFFEVTPSLPLEMKANFISNFIAVRGDKQDVLADKGGEYGPIYLAQHQSCNHRNGDWAERRHEMRGLVSSERLRGVVVSAETVSGSEFLTRRMLSVRNSL